MCKKYLFTREKQDEQNAVTTPDDCWDAFFGQSAEQSWVDVIIYDENSPPWQKKNDENKKHNK